jgi:hypothetical protein
MRATKRREGGSELLETLAAGYIGQALRFRLAHGLKLLGP